jgi:hypothetical protein
LKKTECSSYIFLEYGKGTAKGIGKTGHASFYLTADHYFFYSLGGVKKSIIW